MITFKLKPWRTLGVAATTLGLAACGNPGEGGGEAGGEGGHGEGGEAAVGENGGATPAAPPLSSETGEAAAGESGGEHGEAGVLSAYAGIAGEARTALRIQHLRGFVMAAAKVVEDRGSFSGEPADAAILVQQGLLEVYDPAPDFTRAQMMQRLRAAQEELTRAVSVLDYHEAQLVVRMVDISAGLYQNVLIDGVADPIEYQHSMGAALAAQQTLLLAQDEMTAENRAAYSRAVGELNRFVALWPSREPPATPATYRDVLVQGSRVRLALSPYL